METPTLLVRVQTSTTIMEISQRLKLEIPYDLTISLLSIFPKDFKPSNYSDTCILIFIAAQLIITKPWKKLVYPSTDDWINETWGLYIME